VQALRRIGAGHLNVVNMVERANDKAEVVRRHQHYLQLAVGWTSTETTCTMDPKEDLSSWGWLGKRHHCRSCGSFVCAAHSRAEQAVFRVPIAFSYRVCDRCRDAEEAAIRGVVSRTPRPPRGLAIAALRKAMLDRRELAIAALRKAMLDTHDDFRHYYLFMHEKGAFDYDALAARETLKWQGVRGPTRRLPTAEQIALACKLVAGPAEALRPFKGLGWDALRHHHRGR
jgi:hypothetical protein